MIEILYTLIVTHITIMCVTLYLHRGVTHKAISIKPELAHFMRFWLWLTTGMVTKEWVAIHRKHHQSSDTPDDPHSPQIYGIWTVLFGGAFLYTKASKDKDMINKLGVGCPDDWMENNFYSKFPNYGILLMMLIDILLFGGVGIVIWLVQMLWIPFWAAGVINGLAHYWGYRNYNTKDTARNLLPIGIWIGGEELHNNHHADGAGAKFSKKWYEFDIGWAYIKLFEKLKLVEVRK